MRIKNISYYKISKFNIIIQTKVGMGCIRQTERYFIDTKEVITDLFFMETREIICTCIYKIVKKLCDNIHGMTYIIKIKLSGIDISNTGYFDNSNENYCLKYN